MKDLSPHFTHSRAARESYTFAIFRLAGAIDRLMRELARPFVALAALITTKEES